MLRYIENSDLTLEFDGIGFWSFFVFCNDRLSPAEYFAGTYDTIIDMSLEPYFYFVFNVDQEKKIKSIKK